MLPRGWLYFFFSLDPENTRTKAFEIQVAPDSMDREISVILKAEGPPLSPNDGTFQISPCRNCRNTVITPMNVRKSWYIGIYGGLTGAWVTARATIFGEQSLHISNCARDVSKRVLRKWKMHF